MPNAASTNIPLTAVPSGEADTHELAMDALRNLANNIPNWQRRLEDLNGQIERRQAELGSFARTDASPTASPRSLRNKGSAESLKPQDDGPMHPNLDGALSSSQSQRKQEAVETPSTRIGVVATPPSSRSQHPVALQKQGREAASPHPRALSQAKKKHTSSSIVSAEGAPPTYRTRSMIIVYYDSYVQGVFDELVRFISSSRNLMRKAKMAAKVAQIKRMAELEMADDAKGAGEEKLAIDAIPSLKYINTSHLGPLSKGNLAREPTRVPGTEQPADVYSFLDKGLEFVQSTCEHGAHQFLRDADCYDEISKIQSRLVEVLTAAKQEIERIEREDPELAKEMGDTGKPRTHRSISVRRDIAADTKDEIAYGDRRLTWEVTPSKEGMVEAVGLEVDPHLEDEDMDELPVLQYRSTSLMRNRPI